MAKAKRRIKKGDSKKKKRSRARAKVRRVKKQTRSNVRTKVRREIRIALLGVGNVASALVQALYARNPSGVWHETIGSYRVSDIKIVSAFDIDKRKVGKDLSEAIFASPNVSPKFWDVPQTGIIVQPGIMNYEIPRHLTSDPVGTSDFVNLLKESSPHIVLNLIPSGMPDTSYDYAKAALKAGCSFINATPVVLASDRNLRNKFGSSKLVLVGDDLMSQFGGTAFHKGILDFMNSRGIVVEKSYQLDVGGGNETLNTINEDVKISKRDIKTDSISGELPYKFETVAGTTDYVDYMGNNRTSYFWIKARSLFDSEIKIDVYLRTNDGANAGNVLLDVIRAVGSSLMSKRYGSPKEICDYGFKKIEEPTLLRKAHEEFLKKYSQK
ncbi:MAG: inositol-3-phosphate synthase [Nitrososphaerales archaeon]